MRQRFNVDPRRVYISGFSGGGRVASCLGVAYADIFSGAMPFMGVNFYRDVPAPHGKKFRLNYLPHKDLLAIAKKDGRFVLVTGSDDLTAPAPSRFLKTASSRKNSPTHRTSRCPGWRIICPDRFGLKRL